MSTPAKVSIEMENGAERLNALASEHEIFKIIITSRPQAAIPSSLWSSSYFVFIDSL